jgi:hypothetical protein
MSDTSALSVEQWTYRALGVPNNSGGSLILQPEVGSQGWRILRIRLFAGPNAAGVSGDVINGTIDVVANGCLDLEPAAYNRPLDTLSFFGDGSLLVVEYIYKTVASGAAPTITIT